MEVSILSDTNNPVMNRREINFSVVQEGKTASREEIKTEICKKLNLSPDATIVTQIDQEFGVRRCSGTAHSYKSREILEKAEPRYLLARLTKRAKKGEAGAAAPQGEKEAPKEAKEEKKEEKKEHPKEAKEQKMEEKKEHPPKEAKEEKKHEKEEKKE
jgi:small subunit ribosomal protein S24e